MIQRRALEIGVRLALVPDHSADRQRRHRRNHAVVQRGRRPRLHRRLPRMLLRRASRGLCRCILARVSRLDSLHIGLLVHLRRARGKDRHQPGIVAQRVQTGPRLRWRAAPVRLHHADRHLLVMLNLAREEVRHRAEARRCLRRTDLPRRLLVLQWEIREALRLVQQPDLRMVRRLDLLRPVLQHRRAGEAEQRHLHIRLPARQPHIAHQQIADGDRVRCRLTVSVYAPPPAGRGARYKLQCPSESVVALAVSSAPPFDPRSVAVTRSPTSAHPHTWIGRSRWITAWSLHNFGNRNSAEAAKGDQQEGREE